MGVSALELLRDPHTFAEKLFRRLQGSRDKFETKMLMVQVVSRTIAVHRLVLEPFYTFIARYLQPQQREDSTDTATDNATDRYSARGGVSKIANCHLRTRW